MAKRQKVRRVTWSSNAHARCILDVVEGKSLRGVGRMDSAPLVPALVGRTFDPVGEADPVPLEDFVSEVARYWITGRSASKRYPAGNQACAFHHSPVTFAQISRPPTRIM